MGGERREGGGIRELKDHIKTALDEAIRLRADTEALQTRAGVSSGLGYSVLVVGPVYNV